MKKQFVFVCALLLCATHVVLAENCLPEIHRAFVVESYSAELKDLTNQVQVTVQFKAKHDCTVERVLSDPKGSVLFSEKSELKKGQEYNSTFLLRPDQLNKYGLWVRPKEKVEAMGRAITRVYFNLPYHTFMDKKNKEKTPKKPSTAAE